LKKRLQDICSQAKLKLQTPAINKFYEIKQFQEFIASMREKQHISPNLIYIPVSEFRDLNYLSILLTFAKYDRSNVNFTIIYHINDLDFYSLVMERFSEMTQVVSVHFLLSDEVGKSNKQNVVE
jgi:hypothetical protein